MAIKKAKVFTVTSVKGGAGKSTTVLNLAGIFAGMKKKVLIVDLDFYTGSIATSLNVGVEKDMYKLVNDLANNHFDYMENYVLTYHPFIDVLAAPKDPRYASKIDSKFLNSIIARVEMKYDVILVDTTIITDEIKLAMMDISDEILFLITNDPLDLKNMRTMVAIFKDMGKTNYKIILNNSLSRGHDYFSNYDIKNIIEGNIDYTIPESFYIKNIARYIMDGVILTLNPTIRKFHKKAIKNFEMIAQALLKDKKEK